MEGVDREGDCAQRSRGAAPRREPQRVRARGALRLRVVIERVRPLGRQILKQRSTHGDVDELNAAADAEYRQPELAGNTEECELEEVALAARRIQVRRRLGMVPGRMDILSAGEQETIGAIERARGVRRSDQRREDRAERRRRQAPTSRTSR